MYVDIGFQNFGDENQSLFNLTQTSQESEEKHAACNSLKRKRWRIMLQPFTIYSLRQKYFLYPSITPDCKIYLIFKLKFLILRCTLNVFDI